MLRALSIAVLVTLATSAQAEQRDVLRRLMAEPVTLFDWGMAQLERDIERAAKHTLPERPGLSVPKTGTIYRWRDRRVILYVSRVVPSTERTPEACRATFRDIVASLTETSPGGPDAAGWYLHHAFQTKGHFWTSRFEDVGGKLLQVVELEVSLIAPPYAAAAGDSRRVRCSGRLDAAPEALVVDVGGGGPDAASPSEPIRR